VGAFKVLHDHSIFTLNWICHLKVGLSEMAFANVVVVSGGELVELALTIGAQLLGVIVCDHVVFHDFCHGSYSLAILESKFTLAREL
jgi:hypothetical protein